MKKERKFFLTILRTIVNLFKGDVYIKRKKISLNDIRNNVYDIRDIYHLFRSR